MSRLEWNLPENRTFQTGLDRGVIYLEDGTSTPWDGLQSVSDSGESNVSEYYLDGIKYLAVVSPRDWAGKMTAYTFPHEFGELIGISKLTDGLYADSQPPKRFNLSYRTIVSAPDVNQKPNYKIHLISKAMASVSDFDSESLSNDVNPTSFSFDISAVPLIIPGLRPTAHLIIDSRDFDESVLSQLEDLLYGTSNTAPVFPTVEQLMDVLHFSDDVVIIDNHDGTWTAIGSRENVRLMPDGKHFVVDNAPAEYISEDIYQFYGVDTPAGLSIGVDENDVLYILLSEDTPNVGIDSDQTPYYGPGESGATIHYDTDDVPYVEYN